MHVMLTGKYPFSGNEENLLKEAQTPSWCNNLKASLYCCVLISSEAKQLLLKLCNPDVLGRYSAKDALQSPWITGYSQPPKTSNSLIPGPLAYLDEMLKGKLSAAAKLLFFAGLEKCASKEGEAGKGLGVVRNGCALNRLLVQRKKCPSQFQGKKNEIKNTYIMRKMRRNLLDKSFGTPMAKSFSKRGVDNDIIESVKCLTRSRIPNCEPRLLRSLIKGKTSVVAANASKETPKDKVRNKNLLFKSILPKVRELAERRRLNKLVTNEKSLMLPSIGMKKSFVTSFNLIKKKQKPDNTGKKPLYNAN
eukprot:TRINITY_DN4387_c0_g1_i7.p1 TRINITY_DN4387_c0_g1~~TRINITY_DN4387_c0_g1_i7.p1  ORF type:complete len:306 (-),score=48.82 TRINITY_DN4387_c0_g1_i7:56-973(-)